MKGDDGSSPDNVGRPEPEAKGDGDDGLEINFKNQRPCDWHNPIGSRQQKN